MESHGDPVLAEKIAEMFPGTDHPVAVATVSAGRVRTASRGPALDADFELGSISKGVTGLLYADALTRGEVTADTTLGQLLPLANAPAAAVTLSALSVHCSGLPRLPPQMHPYRKTFAVWRHGINPYGETLDELI